MGETIAAQRSSVSDACCVDRPIAIFANLVVGQADRASQSVSMPPRFHRQASKA